MPMDEQESPINSEPSRKKGKPWFRPNRGGAGYHPAAWQGWLILVGIVAAIVVIVVLFRTGIL